MIQIRDAIASDFASVLRLNDAEVRQTSAMDSARLASLLAMAAHAKVAVVEGEVGAFLIAMREGAPYDSENYRWFASRFDRFLYVDRVVVDSRFGGRGIGSRLYADLFATAQSQGVATMACEYNVEPPNPASRAFHDKFGFREVGTQWVAGGSKCVSLQVAAIAPAAALGNPAASE